MYDKSLKLSYYYLIVKIHLKSYKILCEQNIVKATYYLYVE